jgi:hypothetical protein
LDINTEIIFIVASDKGLSSEWTVALYLPIFGEKNYYYECDGEGKWVYSPYYLWLMH